MHCIVCFIFGPVWSSILSFSSLLSVPLVRSCITLASPQQPPESIEPALQGDSFIKPKSRHAAVANASQRGGMCVSALPLMSFSPFLYSHVF